MIYKFACINKNSDGFEFKESKNQNYKRALFLCMSCLYPVFTLYISEEQKKAGSHYYVRKKEGGPLYGV